MNKAKLKTYAPAARRDFIRAVTDRAHLLGLAEGRVEPIQVSGEVALIGGRAYPKKLAAQRRGLEARIQREGYGAVMEAIAYTWFNRFAALRYMELHGYLGHGVRVLSHPNGGVIPEILEHATDVDLPGLNKDKIIELKLAGNQDAELYRRLLVAQCNQLAAAMPFLFERIDDETELLLPDNLLHSDSLIRKLVTEIDEADWQQVEIIGWLYQFYISEKKDQVIGKVVKSEDIPAATQLFTPNWIVQYLVQNSIGRLWLMANPASTLQSQWPYYIQPAEQTEAVGAALAAITQARIREVTPSPPRGEGGGEGATTLNPETITVLDPACGSGHILVEAYAVLKAIYLERGYRPRDIPRLILENNLHGLDIDDRAAQLAGFALLMKARADDRRLLENPPQLHILSLQESKGLDAATLANALQPNRHSRESGNPANNGFAPTDLFPSTRPQMTLGEAAPSSPAPKQESPLAGVIRQLTETFIHAKTFGSLIRVPETLTPLLPTLAEALKLAAASGDLYAQAAAKDLLSLVEQARLLAMKFDAVVANPPYMGGKGMNPLMKSFAKSNFFESKTDLFAMFIEQAIHQAKFGGFSALVTMHAWMFLSTFEAFREKILSNTAVDSFVHIGSRGFDSISGEVVQTVAFSLIKSPISNVKGCYFKLTEGRSEAEKIRTLMEGIKQKPDELYFEVTPLDLSELPGQPIAYWVSSQFRKAFTENSGLETEVLFRQGMSTTDAERFERLWHEVSRDLLNTSRVTPFIDQEPACYWYPFNKGGARRKWYGNFDTIVRYEKNGQDLVDLVRSKYPNISDPEFVIKNRKYFFRSAITYASVGTGDFSARFVPDGCAYSVAGPAIFASNWSSYSLLALLCSKAVSVFLRAINPTLGFQIADVGKIPHGNRLRRKTESVSALLSEQAVNIARADWNNFENSWEFWRLPLIRDDLHSITLEASWISWSQYCNDSIENLREIEVKNNSLFMALGEIQWVKLLPARLGAGQILGKTNPT